MPFHRVADMRAIPQDPAWYARQAASMSRAEQAKYDRVYNRRYFAPWRMRSMGEPLKEMEWAFRMVQRRAVYDSRRRKVPEATWQQWITNANFTALDSVKGRAITVRHANLRALPTRTTAYRDPWKSTEGFPFDYNQNSALYPNTPLYVSHYSRDRRWVFVHSPEAYGWISVSDMAVADASFRRRFQTGRYAMAVRDNMALYNGQKRISLVKLGTLFPMDTYGKHLLFALRDAKGRARIATLRRPALGWVAPKPLAFTPNNIAYIARQLKRDPYGWGGIAYGRDCSATTRDFFGVFGIFLSRNSSDQAREGARLTNIKPFKGAAKKAAILKHAKPWRSMLYVPGHIGIYIGRYKNEPVILHTYWGVRLKDFSKHTLAHTIITTTEPGKELPNLRRESMMSNTLQTIIHF
jgi:cell wall-associated NlpC family hydrolase